MLTTSRVLGCLSLFFLTLAPMGCGSSSARVELSGAITHAGKPIPAGRIYFNPDLAKGHDGPQGYAEIHDGRYDTRKNGLGAVGGPSIVVIQGYEAGPDGFGAALFDEYSIPIELPRQSGDRDFDVPATAPKTPIPRPGAKT